MPAFAFGLALVTLCPRAQADPLPPGTYLQSCQQPQMHGSTLTAVCPNDILGGQVSSTLNDADYCNSSGHDIANVDGWLRCIYLWDPNGIGVISRMKDQQKDGNTIISWRIDRPWVMSQQPAGYGSINFKPGDSFTVYAGGCVQTGGHGATWKSYTYPTGDNAQQLYSGTIVVPGVISSRRIAGALNSTWKVAENLQPPVLPQLYLRLGYQDDSYSDNGYWGHDNGNSNQCENVAQAYVEISIVRPSKNSTTSDNAGWAPGRAPFDIVWDQVDTQGLPLNPRWFVQGEKTAHPQSAPDFSNTCGKAFSGGNSVNYDVLNSSCTTQMPYTDLDTSPFVGASFPGVSGGAGYCTDDGFLHGHLDWFIATVTGTLHFGSWTTGTGEDDDFNMYLVRDDKSLLTTDEDNNNFDLEFNSDESVDQFKSAWWANLDSTIHNLAGQNGNQTVAANTPLGELIVGKPAVTIGLIGIDGVHGHGHMESHPVFAMAIQSATSDTDDGRDETWEFFVRNSGNEGNCSEDLHFWEGLSGKYYVQLPTPPEWADVSKVSVTSSDAWLWAGSNESGSAKGKSGVEVTKDSTAAYIEVTLPEATETGSNQGGWGVNGEVTIHYTLKAGSKKMETKRAVTPERVAFNPKSGEEPEVDWDKLNKAVTDSATRKRIQTAIATAFPGGSGPKHFTQQLTIAATVSEHKPISGLRRDAITRPHHARSELMIKLNSDLKAAAAAK